MLEDFKLGVEHLARWDKIAVATDIEWIRAAVRFVMFLMPAMTRLVLARLRERAPEAGSSARIPQGFRSGCQFDNFARDLLLTKLAFTLRQRHQPCLDVGSC
jgi:hypothetical protein